MKSYSLKRARRRGSKFWLLSLAVAIVLIVGGVFTLRTIYNNDLRPVSSSTTSHYFTVSEGMGLDQIADSLQQADLIRSAKAFETYVRGSEVQTELQAGTYTLNQSLSVQQIVNLMVKGEVTKNLLTILPGKRLDQIEQAFSGAGYSQDEVNSAFSVSTYAGDPAIASIPAGSSLEGYLYPDSFQKEADTPASTIVQESLDEMQSHLSSDITNGFAAQGLSVYQGVTLASIVVQESGDPSVQPTIAQVFLSRLRMGMDLQSDVTADYASALAGLPPSIGINSPYNTYLHIGLPPGPISNVTASALAAVAHPTNTNYLYFIAGDNGVVHFSQTEAEHEQQIQQYCQQNCAQP